MLLSYSDLSDDQIIAALQELRTKSFCPKSNFAVAAILRYKLPDGRTALIAGVNSEVAGPNTSAVHAEQAANSSAQIELDPNRKLVSVYVMGAMKAITADKQHPDGDRDIGPCGHCLQIICNDKTADAKVFRVSVNGQISPKVHTLKEYLAFAFNTDVLKNTEANGENQANNKPQTPRVNGTLYSTNKLPSKSILVTEELDSKDVFNYLKGLTPLIINLEHEDTNPTTACMLRVAADTNKKTHYIGVLMQEMGFQSTNPFNAAFAQKSTNELQRTKVDEIHLYSSIEKSPRLTSDEIETIAPYALSLEIKVYFYNKHGLINDYTLDQCIDLNGAYLRACFKRKVEATCEQNPTPTVTLQR